MSAACDFAVVAVVIQNCSIAEVVKPWVVVRWSESQDIWVSLVMSLVVLSISDLVCGETAEVVEKRMRRLPGTARGDFPMYTHTMHNSEKTDETMTMMMPHT